MGSTTASLARIASLSIVGQVTIAQRYSYLCLIFSCSLSLFRIWLVLRENLIWSVGDGESVRCWKDNWISDIGPLSNHIPSHSNINLDCSLRELVIKDGHGI
ncbi:hypothetical protein PVK06_008259 [Gossypium arboreum]|uniref:Uncharacterized protein n=1 Tax=Gossypium arboreum TaxID=29729 RepID=A0ABR0QJT9_GOSAR|nr:hypothetical protein PVK06_008259 [Gossypium arboreum]